MLEAIVRYPVKSMLGEHVEAALLEVDGIDGDRGWAVHDLETGLLGSAKHPARFERLLTCRASFRNGTTAPPEVRLPGRPPLRCGDEMLDSALSDLLGIKVEVRRGALAGSSLGRTDPAEDGAADSDSLGALTDNPVATGTPGKGRLFDFAPVHLVTRSTLDALAAVLPSGEADMARFRPNLVLDVDFRPFGESAWVGSRLTIGGAELAVMLPTPRCVVPTLGQPGLDESPDLLRVLSRLNRPAIRGLGPQTCLGVYASVAKPGPIRVGSTVRFDVLPEGGPATTGGSARSPATRHDSRGTTLRVP